MTRDGTALTAQLCEWLAELSWDRLPEGVQAKAVLCLQDHVACAFGGSATEWGQMGVAYARSRGGRPEASLLAVGGRLPAELAAFANGHQANMLDYDDTNLDLGHPGTPIWPAALAAAERAGASGPQLLTAAVAGYELAMRLALATRPTDERFQLVYPVPWQGIGAAAAAGLALGFSADRLRNTIGIASELVPIGVALTPETTFAFKAGKMGQYAMTGVEAALLAEQGFLGKKNIFGEDVPLSVAMGSDRYNAELLWGEDFVFPSVSFKPYPACRFTHTAIEAARTAHQQGVRAEDIQSVKLSTFHRAIQLRDAEPMHFAHGPFCLPYVVALGLQGVEPGPEWYAPGRLHDPELLALSRSIELAPDEALNELTDRYGKLPARLVITTLDGREHEWYVDTPLGEVERPIPGAELDRKFQTLVGARIGQSEARLLKEAIQGLASASSLYQFITLASPETETALVAEMA